MESSDSYAKLSEITPDVKKFHVFRKKAGRAGEKLHGPEKRKLSCHFTWGSNVFS